MPRGRMISRNLSTSQRFASLHTTAGKLAEFCQSLYPLLVIWADDFGRLQGDPFTVKHQVLPTSPRSVAEFGRALQALHVTGLVVWYDVDGRRYLQIVKFEPHQEGLHRRTVSRFPEPPPESSRKLPECPTEEKRTEQKGRERTAPSADAAERDRGAQEARRREHEEIRAFIAKFCEMYRDILGGTYDVKREKDIPALKHLLPLYGFERLVRMAELLLRLTPEVEGWIANTDRGIGILRAKCSWLDIRLRQFEKRRAS